MAGRSGKSIRTKLMALLLLATILPTGISMAVSYAYTKQSVTEKSIRENARLLSLGRSSLEKYLLGLRQMGTSIYSGINLPSSAYTSILGARRLGPNGAPEDVSASNVITNQLYNLYQSNRDIFQVHLYIRANRQSNTLLKGYYRRETNESFVPPSPPDGRVAPFLEVTHGDHRYGTKTKIPNVREGETKVFSVHFPVFRAPTPEVMAYLSLDVQLREVREIAATLYDPRAERLYILNEEGRALYASEGSRMGAYIQDGWHRLPRGDSGHYAWKDGDFDGIVFYNRINSPLMKGAIVKLVPAGHLYGDARTITRINAGVGILFLVVGILAAVVISFRFTAPIKKLIAYTQRVGTGQLDARVDVETEDELGLLARKITDMTRTIDNLIVKEYRLELANKTNQLKALQAQINPHFLYNALQSIASLSLRYRADKVYELITSLGSIMRYAMTTERATVPLQQELAHVENYLLLQQERFGDGLSFAIEAEPGTLGYVVPKMILQPVVENIFKHGYDEGVRSARVRIACRIEGARLVVEIGDNGRGLSAQRMLEVETSVRERNKRSDEGIGLWNVLMRLRLVCGEDAGLKLYPGEDAGLTVVLSIPLPDDKEPT